MALFDTIRAGSSGATDFEVERSLRFNDDDNTYLSRTPSSNGNRRTWTISIWFKTESDSSGTGSGSLQGQRFWSVNNSLTDGAYASFAYENDGFIAELRSHLDLRTTKVFRDPTAWYHVVLALDTTQSTASDRAKLYVNGTQITAFSTASYPSQNHEGGWNSTAEHNIGRELYLTRRYFGGYMAEFTNIDGQQLTPSSFAETDSKTGQWVPIDTSSLTFGTNGFRLQFADNSNTTATTLGKDTSGNGNNWTPNNFSVSSGIGNDSVIDTPTNNFCTYNPLNQTNSVNLSQGNLKFSQSANDQAVTGTMAITSGKWYYEFLKVSGDNPEIGILPTDSPAPRENGQKVAFSDESSGDVTGFKVAFITNNGQQRNGIDYGDSGAITLTGGSAQTGAGYIGIAIDMDNSKIWYTDLSGNFFNSGDPANGTNAAYDFSSTQAANGAVPFVYFATNSGDTGSVNFGQQPFNYTQPSGFNSICSANLPDPTIKLPNKYFDTVLYTGNGTDDTDRTGLNFSPDWVWIKARSAARFHSLYDVVRGAGKVIYSAMNNSEGVDTGLKAFNSDGFRNGTNIHSNENGTTYAAWCWEAGSSTVTNNDGSISAQVRAEPEAGFSIVSYTGGGADATVGHGLGVKPDAIILKNRDRNVEWIVKHKNLSSGKIMYLNLTEAEGGATGTNNGIIEDFSSTSTFSLSRTNNTGNYNNVAVNGEKYVAYCFSGVEGFSKFGRYAGNGNNPNGAYVHLGFKPAWLMIKRLDGIEQWAILYDKAHPRNAIINYFVANADDAEAESGSHVEIDFLSNGFKLREDGDVQNRDGSKYIYFAFALETAKYARAR